VITDGTDLLANRDLGDAPDSSSSIAAAKMLAYPGVFASFPTVYQAGSPPYGPMHLYPRDMYYLGKWVSLETEADIGIDDDGVTNIDPLNDIADRDGADDGLVLPVNMPFCQSTTLDYIVTMTSSSAQRPYVNVWCDWNRDGDWDDKVVCPDGTEVPEWAVQNHLISLTAPGTYTFTTPSFRSWHPARDRIDPMWLRISIADRPWAPTSGVPSTGGCGPATGYKYGETEDYYLQFKDLPLPVKYDWGDAPTGTIAPGYPTIAFNNGARHVIAGPWLGNEKDKPDAEADGQPDTNALGDDNNGSDDENGAALPPLIQGLPAAATVEVNGGGGVVQAWIDFNRDFAWQSTEKIFDGFLPDGVHTLNFTTPETAVPGKTFARFRISRQGGLGPDGPAPDGEVEDHEVTIETSPAVVKKWCQQPELTPEGIDIRIDNGENLPRMVADDFECRQPGKLTHIRFWGSWKDDKKGQIKRIHVRIHPDDPVGLEGADAKNNYSKPGPETLWEGEFLSAQFTEKLYHTVEIAGEWWWDPAAGDGVPGGDKQVWQLDMDVATDKAFLQEGTSEKPRVYWLEIATETADGQFGWKTRRWPDHFMDDAVWYAGTKSSPEWHETFYPHGHKYYATERNSIDMAFCLLFTVDSTQPTSQAVSRTQCPPVETSCPVLRTACPAVKTSCPATDTLCPATDTECPPVSTQCPPVVTDCSGGVTKCPPVETRCPPIETQCPPKVTQCTPTQCPVDTQCPVVQTQCPPAVTQCTPTRCPMDTVCPAFTTRCPKEDTRCPEEKTRCPPVQTQCPPLPTECVATNCPVSTVCPPAPTRCPGAITQCSETVTMCSTVCLKQSSGSAEGASRLLLGSACPAVETDCLTVDQYLAMARGGK
jgi:hypothetical protein